MSARESRNRAALLIGALGVVYGDIGTSPLYALRECFSGAHGIEPSPANVLGVVSLVFWSLTLIVSIKYLTLVMRADNKGEGGILALLSLASREGDREGRYRKHFLLLLGVFGASLLYGDGIITPAVTVLSAVEGLEVATPVFKPVIVPLAVVILIALFRFQRHGTTKVGSIFGPIMLAWFATLAVLGLRGIWLAPGIVQALSPHHGISFFLHNGHLAFIVLGAVFLSVTGAEALYADMGHFGSSPIRRAWFAIVFPALLLNYLGEGALLLVNPGAARNPFFLLAPSWALLPLVGLATMAAVIASQALISGAYSITMQAIQMGYLPRLQIQHTSPEERGQIYMPQVNNFLLLACIGLVLGFGSSSRLAGAYGIAVSLTMLITTALFYSAARRLWGWHPALAGGVAGLFGAIELLFVGANSLKLLQGGWFPLAVGLLLFTVMLTWRRGREMLRSRLAESALPFQLFLADLQTRKLPRVPGTAVFLSGNPRGTPIALLHNLRHNKVLHEHVVLLNISTADVPVVRKAEKIQLEQLRADIHLVLAKYGFMEQPNVPALLEQCADLGLKSDPVQTTFFLSRETIIPHHGAGMARWRRRLFAALSRNAQPVTAFFQIPPNRVVELGMQVQV
jgi:KUP system potassium uptake protein